MTVYQLFFYGDLPRIALNGERLIRLKEAQTASSYREASILFLVMAF